MTSLPLHHIRYCIYVNEVMILRDSNIYISHPLTFHVIFHFSAFWRFLRRHHRNQEEFHQEIPHQITFYKACHVSSLWIIEWHRCILLITGPDTQQFVNYRYLYNSKRILGQHNTVHAWYRRYTSNCFQVHSNYVAYQQIMTTCVIFENCYSCVL